MSLLRKDMIDFRFADFEIIAVHDHWWMAKHHARQEGKFPASRLCTQWSMDEWLWEFLMCY